jgi:hypothetical protein
MPHELLSDRTLAALMLLTVAFVAYGWVAIIARVSL